MPKNGGHRLSWVAVFGLDPSFRGLEGVAPEEKFDFFVQFLVNI